MNIQLNWDRNLHLRDWERIEIDENSGNSNSPFQPDGPVIVVESANRTFTSNEGVLSSTSALT